MAKSKATKKPDHIIEVQDLAIDLGLGSDPKLRAQESKAREQAADNDQRHRG